MADRWLKQSELAEELGLSLRQTAEYTRRPNCPRKMVRGAWLYGWPAFNRFYVEERVASAVKQVTPADFQEGRTRKMAADADLAELELGRLRGSLVEVEVFRSALLDAFGRVRSRLRDFPARAAAVVVGKRTAADVRAVLTRLSEEVLAELRNDPVPDDPTEPPARRPVKRATRTDAEET